MTNQANIVIESPDVSVLSDIRFRAIDSLRAEVVSSPNFVQSYRNLLINSYPGIGSMIQYYDKQLSQSKHFNIMKTDGHEDIHARMNLFHTKNTEIEFTVTPDITIGDNELGSTVTMIRSVSHPDTKSKDTGEVLKWVQKIDKNGNIVGSDVSISKTFRLKESSEKQYIEEVLLISADSKGRLQDDKNKDLNYRKFSPEELMKRMISKENDGRSIFSDNLLTQVTKVIPHEPVMK